MQLTARQLIPRLRPDLLVVGLYAYGYYRMRDPYVLVGNGAGLVSRSWVPNVALVSGGFLVSHFARPTIRSVDFFFGRYWYTGAYLLQLAHTVRAAVSHPAAAAARPPLSEEMAPMLQELLEFQRLADSAGIPMLVLLINPQDTDGTFNALEHEYNTIVSRFSATHRIRLVDPLARFVTLAEGRPVFRLNRDRHWSAAAHDVAAEELAKAIAETSH
jgi:hypothetical protein